MQTNEDQKGKSAVLSSIVGLDGPAVLYSCQSLAWVDLFFTSPVVPPSCAASGGTELTTQAASPTTCRGRSGRSPSRPRNGCRTACASPSHHSSDGTLILARQQSLTRHPSQKAASSSAAVHARPHGHVLVRFGRNALQPTNLTIIPAFACFRRQSSVL